MANLKELSTRPELFTGGHRLCPGCGASIIARQVMMAAADKPVVVANATGCLEVSSTIYPYSAWKAPWFHSAFENAAATCGGIEAAYKALKRTGKITKDIRFIAFGGDGGTHDIGFQSLSGAMERRHRMLYVCYNNEAYMNCLSTSSLIMTKDGLKKITEIKEGNQIYAFDQKSYQLVLKRCTGVFDNGIKDVYELETLHHSIKATENHPFLVLRRNGRGKKNAFIWKTLGQIRLGDEVVVLKNLDSGKSFKFDVRKVKKGDYKVNRLNEVNLPEYSNSDLMEYLGIYVGDGWIRNPKGEVGFALPEGTDARRSLLDLHTKLFGGKVRTDKEYVYINSVNIANFIGSLGFGKGAKNKTIPGWIFTLTKQEKESLLEGLLASDGYKIGRSFRYVSASENLLKSLRLLLQTMDYRVGKIHWQEKKKGTRCVYRNLLKDARYGYICFSRKERWDINKYPSQYRYQNFLIENEYFSTEKVKSIKLVGKEPTLDLRVEDEHNFIADGIVVHNTGIQRSSATPLGAYTTTAPVGKVQQGKQQVRKNLTECMVAHNIPYVGQSAVGYWNDLTTKVQKALDIDGPTFINVLQPCRLGWAYNPEDTLVIGRLAVETCMWPLYEVVDGKYKINLKPKEKKPIIEFLKTQGRFKHLLKPENAHIVEQIQKNIDENWAWLQMMEECSNK